MSGLERDIEEVLARYMSPILAQSVRRRAQGAVGGEGRELRASDLIALRRELEAGVRLFVDPARQPSLLGELARLGGAAAEAPRAESWVVASEPDIARARHRARSLAIALGADEFAAQRVATAASELARNVVLYAGSGRLDVEPRSIPRPSIVLRCVDSGPGIADLEAVLSGRYRSRTGLGKGLRGVKRLAIRFDVQTGPGGTSVEAELAL